MNQALKFEAFNLHVDKFVFTINKDKKEIISGGDDYAIKFFDISAKTTKDFIDVNEEVKAISYWSNKLAYGQGNNLQMVELNSDMSESKFNTNSSILLTNFNSNVKKIVFNEKLNLLVSFSEDDDLHIINLSNLDVFKYKSQHEGSFKNMRISPKGDFLLTTGCDGFLTVYEFNEMELGKINNFNKIKISQKLNLESPQNLDVDINSNNLCVIGGNILLRTLNLDKSNSNEFLKMLHENSISHKTDINLLRWISDQILVTSDMGSSIKIWNFYEKTCLYQIEANPLKNENLNLFSLDFYSEKEKDIFNLIFIDNNGKLNISEKVNFSKFGNEDKNKDNKKLNSAKKFNDTSLKFNPKKGEFTEENDQVTNFLKDFDKELNDADINSNKIATEELLNLSDMEDENGEIKNPEDIEKTKEEKKNAQNQNKVESLADDIIGCLPQQPFISSATNEKESNNSRYLCWNLIGQIVSRQETSFKAIDITFSDVTNKNKISNIDANDLCYAVMNNCGAFLANKLDEENEDEYEKEDARKNAVLEFISVHVNLFSMIKNWSVTLPTKENPICLAIGVDWCAVYTSSQYLRVFSLYGNQKIILSLPQVITMAGYENHLAYVYQCSVPLFGSQSLRFKILNSNEFFNEIYDGIIPLSPEATLTWLGYSEDGVLLSLDSRKIIRGFFFGISNNWIPLLDLEEVYRNTSVNFWMIGMQDEEIYGVELKGFLEEPLVTSKLPIKVHKVQVPFIKKKLTDSEINNNLNENDESSNVNFLEEKLFNHSLFIKHDQNRFNNFSLVRNCRNVRNPDFYYTDNLKDESDIHKRKVEHDKIALSLINNCFYEDKIEKIVGIFETLLLNISRVKAIKICEYHDKKTLVSILNEKLQILKMKEENEKLKSFEHNQILNVNENSNGRTSSPFIVKNNNIINSVSSDNKNIFSSLAINVDNLRAIEEEVRNELGFEKEDLDKIEDLNSLNDKAIATLNLEKKNVFLIIKIIHLEQPLLQKH